MLIIMISSFLYTGCAEGGKPYYVFVMISDGCGFEHVRATNLYQYGEEGRQIYQTFPVQYGMSHHPVDGLPYDPVKAWMDFDWVKFRVTDSAAAATAMATGVKTVNGRVSMTREKAPLETLVSHFESTGLSTGVVTSVPLSHATPAGFGAHNEARHNYAEIAREMLTGSGLDVIMGCGHPRYDDNGTEMLGVKGDYKYVGGPSLWNDILTGSAGNDCNGDGKPDYWTFTDDYEVLKSWMNGNTPARILYIPRVGSTLQAKRTSLSEAEPYSVPFITGVASLHEMTAAAINALDENDKGFFLMIEGGAVDWASHDNLLGRMIEEQIDFNKSVEAVVDWIESNNAWDHSLVIVTADHETGYLWGPGSGNVSKGKRSKRGDWKPMVSRGKGVMPEAVWYSGSHTSSLVPFYAKGYGSSLFSKYVNGMDKVRGEYIDNTAIGRLLFSLFHAE